MAYSCDSLITCPCIATSTVIGIWIRFWLSIAHALHFTKFLDALNLGTDAALESGTSKSMYCQSPLCMSWQDSKGSVSAEYYRLSMLCMSGNNEGNGFMAEYYRLSMLCARASKILFGTSFGGVLPPINAVQAV